MATLILAGDGVATEHEPAARRGPISFVRLAATVPAAPLSQSVPLSRLASVVSDGRGRRSMMTRPLCRSLGLPVAAWQGWREPTGFSTPEPRVGDSPRAPFVRVL